MFQDVGDDPFGPWMTGDLLRVEEDDGVRAGLDFDGERISRSGSPPIEALGARSEGVYRRLTEPLLDEGPLRLGTVDSDPSTGSRFEGSDGSAPPDRDGVVMTSPPLTEAPLPQFVQGAAEPPGEV